jgi:hypothetical protein
VPNNTDLKLLKGQLTLSSTSSRSPPTTTIPTKSLSTVFTLSALMAPPGSRPRPRPAVSCFLGIHFTLCVLLSIFITVYLETLDLQEAEGFLESEYVKSVAKWALEQSERSIYKYGHPTALYALIMAAVRATFFLSY